MPKGHRKEVDTVHAVAGRMKTAQVEPSLGVLRFCGKAMQGELIVSFPKGLPVADFVLLQEMMHDDVGEGLRLIEEATGQAVTVRIIRLCPVLGRGGSRKSSGAERLVERLNERKAARAA